MKLIVHIGLHKTASTYLQHVLNDNHAALADAGLWYEPQEGYPAHHQAAWRILEGDGEALETMIIGARRARCRALVLSSEDLEGALHDDRPLETITTTARACGIHEIEWHVVLRDPGACFASLFAQLQHHVYADALQMFYDAMRRGHVFIDQPMPGAGTPYWYYSFDHHRDLARLSARLELAGGQRLIAHDWRDSAPFPGWRILDREGVLGVATQMPGDTARNARLSRDEVAMGYASRILEMVHAPADQQAILDHFTASLRESLDAVGTYAAIIGKHFHASHAAALREFAVLEGA